VHQLFDTIRILDGGRLVAMEVAQRNWPHSSFRFLPLPTFLEAVRAADREGRSDPFSDSPRGCLEPARNGAVAYRDYANTAQRPSLWLLELTWGHREAGRAVVGARRGGRSRTLTFGP
jgi:hypothetical protein